MDSRSASLFCDLSELLLSSRSCDNIHEFRLHCMSRACIICGSGWEHMTFSLHLCIRVDCSSRACIICGSGWEHMTFSLHLCIRVDCRSRACIICGSGWEHMTFSLHLVHSCRLQVTCVYYTSAWLGTYVASSTSPGSGTLGGFFPSSSSQVNASLMSSARPVGDALRCYSGSNNHISISSKGISVYAYCIRIGPRLDQTFVIT